MAIVREYGGPDLFVTYTCNPNWQEISRELGPGQTANDRPDIVNRVFDLRRQAFLKMVGRQIHSSDINAIFIKYHQVLKDGIYGRVTAHLAVIEFQKRGLPHMHLILWLHTDSQLRTPEDIDAIQTERGTRYCSTQSHDDSQVRTPVP